MTLIAVSQYEIERLPHWQAYEDKILRLVEKAKENQAELLVLSEYAGLELASWTEHNNEKQFAYIQTLLTQYQQFHLTIARQYQLYIQPGTLPVLAENGYYYNRAFFFSPSGKMGHQDKLYLTPFEKQLGIIKPGHGLHLFETTFGKVGITICYDGEFPALSHQLIKAGAELLLVPSCTEKMSGLTRVSICSQARAIEGQCYVAQSSLIGKVAWCDLVDINAGRSAIYCPADSGFPEEGILAQANLNMPMLIYADLAWHKLSQVRQQGEMRNFQDMQVDMSASLSPLTMVDMS